ncbi:MAG: right-handed parallel beta-helix repeat-containing protein [Clostridia bacterium]|nr:right-handed parallel beta-helix repeat-containing protein [Clostridia bacterium]
MQTKIFTPDTVFESDTFYIADRKQYDLYPSDSYEEIHWWWTILNSGNIPLRAVFVLRGLKNVTIDLGGAKLVLHGRIMPFAVYDCENITFRNFSIDYDRPFYTEGVVLESEPGSFVMQIPESFAYRIEGHDFIAVGETWEHRLITGDMLFSCIDPTNGRRSGGIFLGLIGDEIHPRPNPPLPIHHVYADDLGNGKVRLWNIPESFQPQVGHILVMTHEDRRKTAFLLERNTDTTIEHVRLLHIGAMGITANLCHNITVNDYSMYLDEEIPDRHITVNADGFHTFHCTGLMKIENCRFENLLDDAVNIHGNYLVCTENPDPKMLVVENRSAGIRDMEYLVPGDEVYIYRQNTQEVRAVGIVETAAFLPDQCTVMHVTLQDELTESIEPGDILENRRMPEIEIRNCRINCAGGFRISSGKRVLIEDCHFETSGFSILFSGDMNYWFENTGVKNVTIHNCTFDHCGCPVETGCGFKPTEKAPFYHENIRFTDNTVIAPGRAVMVLDNVNHVEMTGNKIIGLREGQLPVVLKNCSQITITP